MQESANLDTNRLVETFERLAKAQWRKQPLVGIKNSEVRTLLCIKNLSTEGHVITVSEISKRMMVTSPTVTQIIKSLNENGYIHRSVDAKDKRFFDIELTVKGERIVQNVNGYLDELFKGLIEKLGKDQSELLVTLLDQVCDYLDNTHVDFE